MRLATDQEDALRDGSRDVLERSTTSAHVRSLIDSATGHDAEFWKRAVDLGWTALALPEQLGGLAGSLGDIAAVVEELGYAGQPGPLPQTLAVSYVARRAGTDDPDVTALLDAVGTGTAIVSWGGVGPDSPHRVTMTNGTLDGTVEFVPDAPSATHLAVPVRDDDGPDLEVVVVVPLADAEVTHVATMDLTRRYGRVRLDGLAAGPVRLPGAAAALLFEVAVVLQCAESTGIARRLLDMTVAYAKQREQFGRPIGSYQALKHRMADMLVETEGCRVAIREAVDALAGDPDDGHEAVSVAKSWVGRAASHVAGDALQIHGGIGFSWEHDLHLFLRRAKTNELLLGAPSWHDERIERVALAGADGAES
ncbi:acyl-CoA dehydrogenase family protein [Jatrophihabitans fulvus]